MEAFEELQNTIDEFLVHYMDYITDNNLDMLFNTQAASAMFRMYSEWPNSIGAQLARYQFEAQLTQTAQFCKGYCHKISREQNLPVGEYEENSSADYCWRILQVIQSIMEHDDRVGNALEFFYP